MHVRDNLYKAAVRLSGLFIFLSVLFLPITSLPFLSHLMGGTMVAPPSVVFAGLALVIWLPVYWIKKIVLPREFLPLSAFIVTAIVSSLLSFYILFPAYKQITPQKEVVSALLTLIIGITCYIVFSIRFTQKESFTWLLRLISIGGAVMLVWSFAQLYIFFFRNQEYPGWMNSVQNLLSLNPLSTFAYMHRANGFAFEPSWLAHQLNVFYLPYWLAATITGYTAFGRRLWRISAENILLLAGMLVLLGSMSRIGLLTLFLLGAYLLFTFSRSLASRLVRNFPHPRLTAFGIVMGLFLLAGAAATGVVYGMSFLDPRLAKLFQIQEITSNWFNLANNLSVAERISYWSIGFYAFGKYPVFGVGLGNAGFYFSQAIPEQAHSLVEIIKIELEFTFLPNIKSLWMRLLGETGLVGFGLFVSWLYGLWISGKYLLSKADPLYRTLGWMGLLAILALVGEGFSIDSFALPYFWISFGILTAVGLVARRTVK